MFSQETIKKILFKEFHVYNLFLGPMKITLHILLFIKIYYSFSFIALPSDIQSFKLISQVNPFFKKVLTYFANSSNIDSMIAFSGKDVFMILDGKNLVAFLATTKEKCHSILKRQTYDYICFYYCLVTDKYRGQRQAYEIMEKSVSFLTKYYKLKNNSILALHVSPYDPMMPTATKVYYSMGFRKGMYVENGPSDLMHKIDELEKKSRDILEVSEKELMTDVKGRYFFLYCKLKDFTKKSKVPSNTFDLTSKLHKMLKKRPALIS